VLNLIVGGGGMDKKEGGWSKNTRGVKERGKRLVMESGEGEGKKGSHRILSNQHLYHKA